MPVWISQQLHHTISTCRVKYKLKPFYGTKDLPGFERERLKWSVRSRQRQSDRGYTQIWCVWEGRDGDIFLHFPHPSPPLIASPHFACPLISLRTNHTTQPSHPLQENKSWDILFFPANCIFIPPMPINLSFLNQPVLWPIQTHRLLIVESCSDKQTKERLLSVSNLIVLAAIFSPVQPDTPAFRMCCYQVWAFWKCWCLEV